MEVFSALHMQVFQSLGRSGVAGSSGWALTHLRNQQEGQHLKNRGLGPVGLTHFIDEKAEAQGKEVFVLDLSE